jgi:hypothetical protein
MQVLKRLTAIKRGAVFEMTKRRASAAAMRVRSGALLITIKTTLDPRQKLRRVVTVR